MTNQNERDSQLKDGFRVYRQRHRSRGWLARFVVSGKRYCKYFSDSAYGSPEAARRAAEQFALENRALQEEFLALRRRFEVRGNSRSRIPGVARYDGGGHRGPYWLAHWTNENGCRLSRRFPIRRFGEAEALQLAIEARERGVRAFRERYEQIKASLSLVERGTK